MEGFERLLPLWVFLCMIWVIALGVASPPKSMTSKRIDGAGAARHG